MRLRAPHPEARYKERRRSEAAPKAEEAVLHQPTPSAGDAGGTSQQRSCLGEHRRPTTTQETESQGDVSPLPIADKVVTTWCAIRVVTLRIVQGVFSRFSRRMRA